MAMNDSSLLIVFLPFLTFFFFFFILAFNPVKCPGCGTRLSPFVSPGAKTKRQWLEGGWTCPNCGIDVDWRGQKVEMPHKVGWATIAIWSMIPVLLAVGIGLLCFLLTASTVTPAKPAFVRQPAAAQPPPPLPAPPPKALPRAGTDGAAPGGQSGSPDSSLSGWRSHERSCQISCRRPGEANYSGHPSSMAAVRDGRFVITMVDMSCGPLGS
jgi:hypothetical protein